MKYEASEFTPNLNESIRVATGMGLSANVDSVGLSVATFRGDKDTLIRFLSEHFGMSDEDATDAVYATTLPTCSPEEEVELMGCPEPDDDEVCNCATCDTTFTRTALHGEIPPADDEILCPACTAEACPDLPVAGEIAESREPSFFDKFVDATLLKEAKMSKVPETTDTDARTYAKKYRELPQNRTYIGAKRSK